MADDKYKIKEVIAREVFDSRGNPTIEAEIYSSTGISAQAIVPSGASTGSNEALELRDGNENRYFGKGLTKAINNIHDKIFPAIKGKDVRDVNEIDKIMLELDGTSNKASLGANAMLSISLASCKLSARAQEIPLYKQIYKLAYKKEPKKYLLPTPMANIINGGKHAGGKLAPQEFMIMPIGFSDFREAIRSISEIYHILKTILKNKYGASATNVGDEGGFGSPVDTSKDALELLVIATEEAGYKMKKEISFALDPAAAEFHKDGNYKIDGEILSEGEMVDYWYDLIQTYPIVSIEDPFDEEAFSGFAELRKKVADKVQIVGDDLTVTNTKRLSMAIEKKSINSLLLKINQIGTITEAIAAAMMCWDNDYSVVVSHRSGETEDTSIADISVGLCSGQIKTGSLARGERTAKYNRLLRIADKLGTDASYAGKDFRTVFKKFI
ncbi:MAG: phosphopyruvate hydratase [Asgard group archaeon]|nr:phosphopyruvate hydratase [Asgard group archaeon]